MAVVVAACSRQADSEPRALNPDQAWVRSACLPAFPDTAGWPRYRVGRITIAVPPEYRRGASSGFSLSLSRGTAELSVTLQRKSDFGLLGYNNPGQVNCTGSYGGFPTEVYSWHGRGEYLAVALWSELNAPSERPSVRASIHATRLQDAIELRDALHTIALTPERGR